jgi:hypothetical protein
VSRAGQGSAHDANLNISKPTPSATTNKSNKVSFLQSFPVPDTCPWQTNNQQSKYIEKKCLTTSPHNSTSKRNVSNSADGSEQKHSYEKVVGNSAGAKVHCEETRNVGNSVGAGALRKNEKGTAGREREREGADHRIRAPQREDPFEGR